MWYILSEKVDERGACRKHATYIVRAYILPITQEIHKIHKVTHVTPTREYDPYAPPSQQPPNTTPPPFTTPLINYQNKFRSAPIRPPSPYLLQSSILLKHCSSTFYPELRPPPLPTNQVRPPLWVSHNDAVPCRMLYFPSKGRYPPVNLRSLPFSLSRPLVSLLLPLCILSPPISRNVPHRYALGERGEYRSYSALHYIRTECESEHYGCRAARARETRGIDRENGREWRFIGGYLPSRGSIAYGPRLRQALFDAPSKPNCTHLDTCS